MLLVRLGTIYIFYHTFKRKKLPALQIATEEHFTSLVKTRLTLNSYLSAFLEKSAGLIEKMVIESIRAMIGLETSKYVSLTDIPTRQCLDNTNLSLHYPEEVSLTVEKIISCKEFVLIISFVF